MRQVPTYPPRDGALPNKQLQTPSHPVTAPVRHTTPSARYSVGPTKVVTNTRRK
jgi:hypothetical protein